MAQDVEARLKKQRLINENVPGGFLLLTLFRLNWIGCILAERASNPALSGVPRAAQPVNGPFVYARPRLADPTAAEFFRR